MIRSDAARSDRGFTLVELVVVIAIIATLFAILVPTIGLAQRKAAEAQTTNDLKAIQGALDDIKGRLYTYPGAGKSPDEAEIEEWNQMPDLMNVAYRGKKPYFNDLKLEKIGIYDSILPYDPAAGLHPYRKAQPDDVKDKEIDLFFLDGFGNPFCYRENESKREKEGWMIKKDKYDLWSYGPDGVNEAWIGLNNDNYEEMDDIGNW